MADKKDIRRRAFGAVFLIAALGMLIIGETALSERLRSNPAAFLIFWMACFVCVALAILVAILDLAVVRRRVREEQRELAEQTLHQIARSHELKSKSISEPSGNSTVVE